MQINQLKASSITPFIKLLETKGQLHGEHFVGMGIHDDHLFLLKLNARPERVVVTNGSFAFLNKKADGPTFSPEYNQTVEQAAKEYKFHGKDAGGFSDVMMVPETEMHRVLMITALKTAEADILAGKEPSEMGLASVMLADLAANPNAAEMIREIDPTITHEEANMGMDLLGSALNELAQGTATPQAPVDFSQVMEPAGDTPAEPAATTEAPKADKVEPAPVREASNDPDPARAFTGRLFNRFGWGH
jgi:hypothetical protein